MTNTIGATPKHDHVAEAVQRLQDKDWPSFGPDQIVHVRIGDIRSLISDRAKLRETLEATRLLWGPPAVDHAEPCGNGDCLACLVDRVLNTTKGQSK